MQSAIWVGDHMPTLKYGRVGAVWDQLHQRDEFSNECGATNITER